MAMGMEGRVVYAGFFAYYQGTAMHLQAAIPILRIFSVEKARDFYLDFLGFTWDWEHRFEAGFPLYAQVHRDDLVLHLSEHHGDATPGSAVFAGMHYSHGVAWIPLFFFALALGYLYQRTRSLVAPIVLHMALNASSMVMLWLSTLGERGA